MRRRSPRSTRTDTLFPYTTLVRSFASVDIVFCALPHGLSQDLVRQLPAHLKVVDLGADFRLRDPQDYRKWYGLDHAAPELQPSVIYGLTEFYRDEIRGARLVAGTGCNAATVQYALRPLVTGDRKSTRLNYSHYCASRMPSYA